MVKEKYFVSLKRSTKNWRFWVKLLIGVMQIASIIIFITVASAVEGNIYAIPEHLSYFTTESNIFCGYFFIFSAFFHHNEGKGKFDNSEVAKLAITYVTLTIIIYNLNQLSSSVPYHFYGWKFVMSFLCEHSLVPFLAIIYYLFFYNHEKAATIKEFSKKWVWIMVGGLVLYLAVFSIIGEIAKILKWKALYFTINGGRNPTTFVYPFLDWYHGVGFFKSLPAWLECIVMLTGTLLASTITDYCYTLIVLAISKNKIKANNLQAQSVFKENKKNVKTKKSTDQTIEKINLHQLKSG